MCFALCCFLIYLPDMAVYLLQAISQSLSLSPESSGVFFFAVWGETQHSSFYLCIYTLVCMTSVYSFWAAVAQEVEWVVHLSEDWWFGPQLLHVEEYLGKILNTKL